MLTRLASAAIPAPLLRDALSAAWQRGATVVTTSSDAPMIRELYDQHPFELDQLEASYALGGRAATRRPRFELVITGGDYS